MVICLNSLKRVESIQLFHYSEPPRCDIVNINMFNVYDPWSDCLSEEPVVTKHNRSIHTAKNLMYDVSGPSIIYTVYIRNQALTVEVFSLRSVGKLQYRSDIKH